MYAYNNTCMGMYLPICIYLYICMHVYECMYVLTHATAQTCWIKLRFLSCHPGWLPSRGGIQRSRGHSSQCLPHSQWAGHLHHHRQSQWTRPPGSTAHQCSWRWRGGDYLEVLLVWSAGFPSSAAGRLVRESVCVCLVIQSLFSSFVIYYFNPTIL